MNKITQYIIDVNTLNYNEQCKYIKKKLLSSIIDDIQHIMFFKKLQIILQKLPHYLKDIEIKINERGDSLFNFFFKLDDRSYFKDDDDINGFVRVDYIKVSNNIYQIHAVVKNSPISIISYIIIS